MNDGASARPVPVYVAPAARYFDELTPEEQRERREQVRQLLAQACLPVDQVQA